MRLPALMSLALLLGASAPAERTLTGSIGAAPYRIDVPARWNGDLIMLLHGYESPGTPRDGDWRQDPTTPALLARGYAVAQSGYASQGWAISDALADNEALRKEAITRIGKPRATYVIGFSMGGHLTLATIERFAGGYDGAISFCGLNMTGTDVGQLLVKNLAALGYFFPAEATVADLPASLTPVTRAGIEAVLRRDEAAAARLATALDIPRAGLADSLSLDHEVLVDIRKRAGGGMPVDTRNIVYAGFGDDAAFNAGVRRYTGDPAAVRYLAATPQLTGKLSDPLLLRSNAADSIIPPRYGDTYTAAVTKAGRAARLTRLPDVPGDHCELAPKLVADDVDTLTGRKSR